MAIVAVRSEELFDVPITRSNIIRIGKNISADAKRQDNRTHEAQQPQALQYAVGRTIPKHCGGTPCGHRRGHQWRALRVVRHGSNVWGDLRETGKGARTRAERVNLDAESL